MTCTCDNKGLCGVCPESWKPKFFPLPNTDVPQTPQAEGITIASSGILRGRRSTWNGGDQQALSETFDYTKISLEDLSDLLGSLRELPRSHAAVTMTSLTKRLASAWLEHTALTISALVDLEPENG